MKKTSTTTDDRALQRANTQIDDLLRQAQRAVSDIRASEKNTRKTVKELRTEVNASVKKAEHLFSDLDDIEKEAGDELDALVLRHADDVAGE